MAKTPRIIPPMTAEQIARFWSYVDSSGGPDECWPWKRHRLPRGYGLASTAQKLQRYAHRVAHFLTTGEQPEVVRHACDNPPCCNPAHIQGGTQAQNIQDAIQRNRFHSDMRGSTGMKNGSAKLTDDAVLCIRYAYAGGARQSLLARQFGVSMFCIGRIVRGRGWIHVDGPVAPITHQARQNHPSR